MAQITEVRLVDDLDNGVADETVEFAVDGKTYEIDLSSKNATRLREALAQYVGSARRAGKTSSGSKMTQVSGTTRTTTDRERTTAIREWATGLGLPISDRGRIKKEVVEAFDAKGTAAGVAMLNDLYADAGIDRTAPEPDLTQAVTGVNESLNGKRTQLKATNPKAKAHDAKRAAEDVTDEEVLKYREDNGLEVKRRGKDGTGKVYPMAMASYRKQYMEAHEISA